MENLYVSDLFGHNVTNNTPIIIINLNKPQDLMIKIAYDKSNNTSIWKYNMDIINELLQKRNIDPTLFLEMGHVFCNTNELDNLPKIIILANKNICLIAHEYENVINYANGQIIIPYNISSKNKKYSIGMFYVNPNEQLNLSKIGIISDKFIISDLKKKSKTDQILDSNEFGLLSHSKYGFKTISRTQSTINKFKLLNDETDKYLTVVNNDVISKQKLNTLSQTFSYNAQGELINDDKCLTHKDSKIVAEQCSPDNENQKWTITQNKILPANNLQKCLDISSLDKTTVQLSDCDSIQTQNWDTEIESNIFNDNVDQYSISSTSTDYTWGKYKGKTLALVENTNPWFINSDVVTGINHSENCGAVKRFMKTQDNNIPFYQPNYIMNLRNNENYKSNFIMDPNDPTFGYGYSFSSRGKNLIENFEGEQIQNSKCPINKQIGVTIGLIILFFAIYKIWQYYNKS